MVLKGKVPKCYCAQVQCTYEVVEDLFNIKAQFVSTSGKLKYIVFIINFDIGESNVCVQRVECKFNKILHSAFRTTD